MSHTRIKPGGVYEATRDVTQLRRWVDEMTTSARGSARERRVGEIERRERRNVAASARSELQLSPSGRGSERSRVKAVKGREKEKRAGRRVARPRRETTSERKVKALSPQLAPPRVEDLWIFLSSSRAFDKRNTRHKCALMKPQRYPMRLLKRSP